MSSISAGTSGGTALVSTGDTTGALVIKTGGSATTAATFNADQTVTLAAPLPVASGGTGSTTLSGITTGTATNLAGGSNGTIPYQSAAGTTQMLAVGTSGQVLQTNGVGAPTWTTVSTGAFGTDLSYEDYSLTLSSGLCTGVNESFRMQAVSLDGTSELMVIHGSASAHAVVFNTSTKTFGTPVLLRTADFSSTQLIAVAKVSSTSVLVCSLPSTNTALETVVLTISGSTITVGTALATTLAANSNLIAANTRLVTVGSSFVLNYFTTADNLPKFRAITVSGSTPSIGAQLAYAGGAVNAMHHSYAHSASILLHFSMTASTTVFVLPITVSGTTLTAGTAATVSTTDASFIVTGALSSSRYALAYLNSTGRGAVVSVAGTTASISTAPTTMAVTSWGPQMQVFGNQAFIRGGSAASENINVLTDTAGVASLGTDLTSIESSAFAGYLSTSKVLVVSSTAGTSSYTVYGIAGATPELEKSFQSTALSTTTRTMASALYSRPLSGPPQSGSGNQPSLRTSSGKLAAGLASSSPFTASIDGSNAAELQQSANPFSTYNDGISEAVVWGLPTASKDLNTAVQLRKVTLV
jgi:hypothetical protein